ncbi:hypothetical protein [Wolbachia endosymbiont of Dactylopius coccus]|nr:MAG: hypothetical protein TV42_05835 [Wolbachia endosymbiont of Dactylopius coccus]
MRIGMTHLLSEPIFLLSCLNFAFLELIHVLIFPLLCLQLFQLPFLGSVDKKYEEGEKKW